MAALPSRRNRGNHRSRRPWLSAAPDLQTHTDGWLHLHAADRFPWKLLSIRDQLRGFQRRRRPFPRPRHVSSHGWTNGVQGWLQLQVQGIESFLLDYAAGFDDTCDMRPRGGTGVGWTQGRPPNLIPLRPRFVTPAMPVRFCFSPGVVHREGDLVQTHRSSHDQPIRHSPWAAERGCTVSQRKNGDREGLGTSDWRT